MDQLSIWETEGEARGAPQKDPVSLTMFLCFLPEGDNMNNISPDQPLADLLHGS